MEIYGYVRVSSHKGQDPTSQLELLRAAGVSERNIITDIISGKTFDRKGFNSLVGTDQTAPLLREGDLLIVTELDRLGRDYTELLSQWRHITQTLKADIKVLDMPLLDTTKRGNSLDGRFVADLVLQILAYVAQRERELNAERRKRGIDAMPVNEDGKRLGKSGKTSGRPEATYPDNWSAVISDLDRGEITAVEAMRRLELKKTTFYRLLKAYRQAGSLSAAADLRKKTLRQARQTPHTE